MPKVPTRTRFNGAAVNSEQFGTAPPDYTTPPHVGATRGSAPPCGVQKFSTTYPAHHGPCSHPFLPELHNCTPPPHGPLHYRWIQGDALELPLEPNVFDAATLGYGLRNVGSVPGCLAELSRVLKPGATLACLDFNNTDAPIADAF